MSSKDFLKSLVLGQLGNGLVFGAWAFSDFPLSFYKKGEVGAGDTAVPGVHLFFSYRNSQVSQNDF